MDRILIITVLTIFGTAFIGTIIKYRLRDKCLRDFRGYFVNLECLDGRRVGGALQVHHNGLELVYSSPILHPNGGHVETSTLLYQAQFGTIRALKRFHDELSPDNQARRRKEIQRTYHPNVIRRFWRGTRNLFNLLRDAFSQAVSMFIGAFKKTGASVVLNTQDARIASTAQSVISQGGASYEPMLEKYIGRNVVLEIVHDGKAKDNFGILKEYSDAFIMILDVPVVEEHEFNLAAAEPLRGNQIFDFTINPVFSEPNDEGRRSVSLGLEFFNKSRIPVELVRAEGNAYDHELGLTVGPGASTKMDLSNIPVPFSSEKRAGMGDADSPLPSVRLWVRCRRYMDMIVPRAIGTVRHGAEPFVPDPSSGCSRPEEWDIL